MLQLVSEQVGLSGELEESCRVLVIYVLLSYVVVATCCRISEWLEETMLRLLLH